MSDPVLIRGGRVIDPSQTIDAIRDVLVVDGVVAEIGEGVDAPEGAREIDGVRVITARVEGVDPKELRPMVDDLRARLGSGVVLLAAEANGRVSLALGVTQDLTGRLSAGDLVREVAQVVGGRGGGRKDFAQAGGDAPERLDAAFERLEALLGAD